MPSVVVQKGSLLITERPRIHALCQSRCLQTQGRHLARNKEVTVVGERDESTVKQVIDMWRKKQTITAKLRSSGRQIVPGPPMALGHRRAPRHGMRAD